MNLPRGEKKSKEPRLIGEILREVMRDNGLKSGSKQQIIAEVWPEVVGNEIAQRTQTLTLRGGELSVSVDSAPLFYELVNFSGERIKNMLNEKLGSSVVRKINYHMNEVK